MASIRAFSSAVSTGPRNVTTPSCVMTFTFFASTENPSSAHDALANELRHAEIGLAAALIQGREGRSAAIALVPTAVVGVGVRGVRGGVRRPSISIHSAIG